MAKSNVPPSNPNESMSTKHVISDPNETHPQGLAFMVDLASHLTLEGQTTSIRSSAPQLSHESHLRSNSGGNSAADPHEVDQIQFITIESEAAFDDEFELPRSLVALLDALMLQSQSQNENSNNTKLPQQGDCDDDDEWDNASVDSLRYYRRSGHLVHKTDDSQAATHTV